jgi:hypothetical protein
LAEISSSYITGAPGLAGVIKTLADELGPSGIRINGLLPARIATDSVRESDALSGDPDEVRARQSELIPLRMYGEPEEFGRAAAFGLSPAASYMTGRNDPPSMALRSARFEPTRAPFLGSDRPVETQRDVTVTVPRRGLPRPGRVPRADIENQQSADVKPCRVGVR